MRTPLCLGLRITLRSPACSTISASKPEFQRYISEPGAPHAPHAGEGALFASNHSGRSLGRMLAFCIAGHHAGLANGVCEGGGTAPLDARLALAEKIT